MGFDFDKVFHDALGAFTGKAVGASKEILTKAREYIRELVSVGDDIAAKVKAGKMKPAKAANLLKMAEIAAEAVAIGTTGQLKIALENGINAALKVVTAAIRVATGVAIPGFP